MKTYFDEVLDRTVKYKEPILLGVTLGGGINNGSQLRYELFNNRDLKIRFMLHLYNVIPDGILLMREMIKKKKIIAPEKLSLYKIDKNNNTTFSFLFLTNAEPMQIILYNVKIGDVINIIEHDETTDDSGFLGAWKEYCALAKLNIKYVPIADIINQMKEMGFVEFGADRSMFGRNPAYLINLKFKKVK